MNRKIEFFEMLVKDIDSGDESAYMQLKNVLITAFTYDYNDRKVELSANKFIYLDLLVTEEDIQLGIITCGLTKYRPNYVDKNNGSKRENQKTESEGDEEKVHFAIKYSENKVFLLVELNGKGIQTDKVGQYFGSLTKKVWQRNGQQRSLNTVCRPIPIDNMVDVINNMNKASVVELYMDKRILGSEFLRLTNRTTSVKQEIVLTIKKARNRDANIKDAAQDMYTVYSENSTDVKRMRIKGNDDQDIPFQVDTSFFGKKTFINFAEDIGTGTVNTTDALRKLKELAQTL